MKTHCITHHGVQMHIARFNAKLGRRYKSSQIAIRKITATEKGNVIIRYEVTAS